MKMRGRMAFGIALLALVALLFPQSDLLLRFALGAQRALGGFSARFSFPLGEAMYLGCAVLIAAGLLRALWRARCERGRPLLRFLSGLALSAALLLLGYALLWQPIARSHRLPEPTRADSASLKALADALGDQANALWTDKFPQAEEAVESAAQALLKETGTRPVIKTARYPEVLARARLAGICFPFSGEALIRAEQEGLSLPFVAAHEGAHQLGYGSEAEANYLAYRACLRTEPAARYSATAYMLYYALDNLAREDATAWAEARSRLDGRVLADVDRIAAGQSAGKARPGAERVFLNLTGQRRAGDYASVVHYLADDFSARKLNGCAP